MSDVLLSVNRLKTYFPVKKGVFNKKGGFIKAVDDVSFNLNAGETLGLVGESGCGKSTLGRSILRLIEPSAGTVSFKGNEITDFSPSELRKLRSKIQIVFQDPYASLNPRMKIESILAEAFKTHHIGQNAQDRKEKVLELLDIVGLKSSQAMRYPHEFSGGQRQRIGIARAIAVNPSLVIADEPVSSLDVAVQAQILNLFQNLQKRLGLTYVFITHDLSVVKHVSSRIAVMYLGRIVELSDKNDLFENPLHPYTKALISAVPIPNPETKKERIVLEGDVPSPDSPPQGCRFHPRCPFAMEVCKTTDPRDIEVEPGRFVNCHLYDDQYNSSQEPITNTVINK